MSSLFATLQVVVVDVVVGKQLNKMYKYIQMSIEVLSPSVCLSFSPSLPFCIICAREYPVKSTNPSEQ